MHVCSWRATKPEAEFEAYVLPTTKYLTLGPRFYTFRVLSPRICFCFVNPYSLAGCAAFFAILRLAVSKHDLKASGTFFQKLACDLGFAGTVFIGLLPLEGRLNYEAYNADTKS